MDRKITEGTINANNIHVENLVKEVSVIEWNDMQNTIAALQCQVNTLAENVRNQSTLISQASHTTNKGGK